MSRLKLADEPDSIAQLPLDIPTTSPLPEAAMDISVPTLIQHAIANFQSGNMQIAEALLQGALKTEPENFDALHVLGVVCSMQGKHEEAADLFGKAVAVRPDSGLARFNLGATLSSLSRDEEALPHHREAVRLSPQNQDAWLNVGMCLSRLGQNEEALACFDEALRLRPGFAQALGNRGAVLGKLGRHEEALASFGPALSANLSDPGAWTNMAGALAALRRYDEALEHYDRALGLRPDQASIWIRKADLLVSLGRMQEASANYDQALRLNPNDPDVLCKKGDLFNQAKQHLEALAYYDRASELQPGRPLLAGSRISTKLSMCDWRGIEGEAVALLHGILGGKEAAAPFDALCALDSPAAHRMAAESHAVHFARDRSLGNIRSRPAEGRIRLGYFSHDFHHHATAILTAELFELHDRDKFEVIAFSFGPRKDGQTEDDPMRARLLDAFDDFIDISGLTDREAAQLARDRKIDIAIDLQGYQTVHRTGIFACRAAPVQVNYLAYPGTMGAKFIDYLIADRTLIPPENRRHYTEKIAWLPGSYQSNDRKRAIADRVFTRTELGLPEDGVVFCCFNGNHKITPDVFDSWMAIMREVPESVLWLLETNPLAERNLRSEAESRGVAPDRLVFAGHMALPEHLARHRAADLFLDTLPYNAHTTASDALWAGLPVVTLIGESFPARVAASLLNAIGMPELIARSKDDFVRLAVGLAADPAKLAETREKLARQRLTAPLFDTPLYVRQLEAVLAAMYWRYRSCLPPDDIVIG